MLACHAGGRGFESRPLRQSTSKEPCRDAGFFVGCVFSRPAVRSGHCAIDAGVPGARIDRTGLVAGRCSVCALLETSLVLVLGSMMSRERLVTGGRVDIERCTISRHDDQAFRLERAFARLRIGCARHTPACRFARTGAHHVRRPPMCENTITERRCDPNRCRLEHREKKCVQPLPKSGVSCRISRLGAVVQLVRMLACHAGGRGFESRPLRHLQTKTPAEMQGFFVCAELDPGRSAATGNHLRVRTRGPRSRS